MDSKVYKITPYLWGAFLVFDEKEHGLEKEPLIEGVPEILFELCDKHKVKKQVFNLYFSEAPFTDYQLQATRAEEQGGGYWYVAGDKRGWLCPALFCYFEKAPDNLYFKVDTFVLPNGREV